MNKLSQIKSHYEVLIVGGGIVGAGIFRDLALHGIEALLIDAKDFSSQTSRSSSKMLHGGIRYLENMDFNLVWEALHEKNLWLKLAPHLCFESPFYLPIFSDSLRPTWMIRTGLFLYDLLSEFKNSPHSYLNPQQSLKNLPLLKSAGLKGCGVYHDAIVDDLKLTLEVIFDGNIEPQVDAINHVALKDFNVSGECIDAWLEDQLTGECKKVRAKEVVFATGPFTDKLLRKSTPLQWTDKMIPSKGSHLWIDRQKFPIEAPVVLTPNDGRVIFVIPQDKRVLVGTTEEKVDGNFFDIHPSQKEIDYLLTNANEFFPGLSLRQDSIIGRFSGIRPLVKESDQQGAGKTAREHKYFQPLSNVHVLIGGKYTTFRVMASEVAQVICEKLARTYSAHKSERSLRQKSLVLPFVGQKIPPLEEVRDYLYHYELARSEDDFLTRIRSDN